jgi:hypothetical protein
MCGGQTSSVAVLREAKWVMDALDHILGMVEDHLMPISVQFSSLDFWYDSRVLQHVLKSHTSSSR